jgi:hypothetical protein
VRKAAFATGILIDARKIGVGRIEQAYALRPLVQPKPSCVGYSPPPADRPVVITSYFSSNLPDAVMKAGAKLIFWSNPANQHSL